MSRLPRLLILASLWFCAMAEAQPAAAGTKPVVLVMSGDDVGYGTRAYTTAA